MNEQMISQICLECLSQSPHTIERCAVGQGNYVYIVECGVVKYVVRCSVEADAYQDSIHWLQKLATIDIPVPKVIGAGRLEEYEYLILSYFEGKDIGLVYPQLTACEKREIAKELVQIQDKVATLAIDDVAADWSWCDFIKYILARAKERIAQNGYFDVKKVERLQKAKDDLNQYFAGVEPTPYLDDISSKNLLIHEGKISGIIDIDWIGIGDKLTYVALTQMALLNLEYDTDYVEYILEEMQVSETEKQVFLFYTLMYCVDFMGERGMQFMDKRVEVNEKIVDRLNHIYDKLWMEWIRLGGKSC